MIQEKYGHEDTVSIPISLIYKALNSSDFLSCIPYFSNYTSTRVNVEIIIAAIQLTKQGLLTRYEISQGLSKYLLSVRELEVKYLPIHPMIIIYTLRLLGRMMSTNAIKKWMKQYFKNKKEHGVPEDPETTGYKNIDNLIAPTIQTDQVLKPHEFLFLMAHSQKTDKCLNQFPGSLKMLKTGMIKI